MAGRGSDYIASLADDFPTLKAKWVVMQRTKRSGYDDLAFVPDEDLLESTWIDSQMAAAQEGGKDAAAMGIEKPQFNLVSKFQPEQLSSGTLASVDSMEPAVPVRDTIATMVNGLPDEDAQQAQGTQPVFKEDEMESWLQYPVDDATLEGGSFPDTTTWNDSQLFDAGNAQDTRKSAEPNAAKRPEPQQNQDQRQQQSDGLPPANGVPTSQSSPTTPMQLQVNQQQLSSALTSQNALGGERRGVEGSRAARAAAALAMGAQRAVGLMIEPGRNPDTLQGMRTSSLPTLEESSPVGRQGAGSPAERSSSLPVPVESSGAEPPRAMGTVRGGQGAQQQQPARQLRSFPSRDMARQLSQGQGGAVSSDIIDGRSSRPPCGPSGRQGLSRAQSDATALLQQQQHGAAPPLNFSHFSRAAHLYSRENLRHIADSLVDPSVVPAAGRASVQPSGKVGDSPLATWGRTNSPLPLTRPPPVSALDLSSGSSVAECHAKRAAATQPPHPQQQQQGAGAYLPHGTQFRASQGAPGARSPDNGGQHSTVTSNVLKEERAEEAQEEGVGWGSDAQETPGQQLQAQLHAVASAQQGGNSPIPPMSFRQLQSAAAAAVGASPFGSSAARGFGPAAGMQHFGGMQQRTLEQGMFGCSEASGRLKRAREEQETTDFTARSDGGQEESLDTRAASRRTSTMAGGPDGAVDKCGGGGGETTAAAKRARAAEVHNMSERRRRDRINERMRMLQELIPNSNKTDKASMLDEAIEYLKMLQLQLQVMSMRTGMAIPPSLAPVQSGIDQQQHPSLAAPPLPLLAPSSVAPAGFSLHHLQQQQQLQQLQQQQQLIASGGMFRPQVGSNAEMMLGSGDPMSHALEFPPMFGGTHAQQQHGQSLQQQQQQQQQAHMNQQVMQRHLTGGAAFFGAGGIPSSLRDPNAREAFLERRPSGTSMSGAEGGRNEFRAMGGGMESARMGEQLSQEGPPDLSGLSGLQLERQRQLVMMELVSQQQQQQQQFPVGGAVHDAEHRQQGFYACENQQQQQQLKGMMMHPQGGRSSLARSSSGTMGGAGGASPSPLMPASSVSSAMRTSGGAHHIVRGNSGGFGPAASSGSQHHGLQHDKDQQMQQSSFALGTAPSAAYGPSGLPRQLQPSSVNPMDVFLARQRLVSQQQRRQQHQ